MSTDRCVFEDELIDALGRGFVNADLTRHIAACESCNELQLVAGALLDDRKHAMTEAAVPSSGTMWWRMQVRLRQDAQSTARRALLIGQAATILIAVFLTASLLGVEIKTEAKELYATIQMSTKLLLVFTASLLLLPIAGWVAVRQLR